MNELRSFQFYNGYWIWDDVINKLVFINRDQREQLTQRLNSKGSVISSMASSTKSISKDIRFKGNIDDLEKAKFRRHFQRRVRPNDPNVVTIQDLKDVVLFTTDPTDLSMVFVKFFHTPAMDEFLRALIVYFSYYFQIWNHNIKRREEAKRKLRQPIVDVLENVIRDNLADLRSVLARNYVYIMMGLQNTNNYYHMKNHNNVSLSDKDRRQFEMVMVMAARVVWIALEKRYYTLIENEMNRLFRTNLFNSTINMAFIPNSIEEKILIGTAFSLEKKLKHRSPVVQEILLKDHDYRLLAIGKKSVDFLDDRTRYFQALFSAPEDKLPKLGITVGILGLPRNKFNAMLEMDNKRKSTQFDYLPEFILTKNSEYIGRISKFQETDQTKRARKKHCKNWMNYLQNELYYPQGIGHDNASYSQSIVLAQTMSYDSNLI